MGDMGDFFREEKESYKLRCEKRNGSFEPQLLAVGAIKKSDAVYELDGFFCYPTKGFAMNKRNSKERVELARLIEVSKRRRELERFGEGRVPRAKNDNLQS